MSTNAQIAANRENVQASTGPASTEGKARSARNAVKLGPRCCGHNARPLLHKAA